MLTLVGSSTPDLLRGFANRGIGATDVPVLGHEMVEAVLEGPDTGKLVGRLSGGEEPPRSAADPVIDPSVPVSGTVVYERRAPGTAARRLRV